MKRRRSLLLTLASALVLFCTSATGFDYKVFPSFIASPTLNLAASPSFQTSAWRGMDVHNVCFGNRQNDWSRNFGKAVSISNTWMLVTSDEYVMAYKKVLTAWVLTQTFNARDSQMDRIQDVAVNERFLVVSMYKGINSGMYRVYVYEIAAGGQSWIKRLDPGGNDGYFSTNRNPNNNQGSYNIGNRFGYSVSINENNFIFVGAPFAYSGVFIFFLNGDNKWVAKGDKFFYGSPRSEAGRFVTSNKKWMMTGSRGCNAIEIFKWDQASNTFPHHEQLAPPNAVRASKTFGYNIGLSNDNWMVTSAPQGTTSDYDWVKGYAYKYDETTSTWQLKHSWGDNLYSGHNNGFGFQVAIAPDASRVFFGSGGGPGANIRSDGMMSFKRVAGTDGFEDRHEHRAATGETQDDTDGYNEVGWGEQRGSFKIMSPAVIGSGKLGGGKTILAPNGDLAIVAGYNVLIYTAKSCTCRNGVASSGSADCPQDGTISCQQCNAGYTLNSGNCNTKSNCVVAGTGEAGTIDCGNGGSATGKTGDCSCTCLDGYTGIKCLVSDVCSVSDVSGAAATIHCLHGGEAQGVTGSCSCACPVGYRGSATCAAGACTVAGTGEAGTIDCANAGIATGVTDTCACSCAAGFLGLTCDILDSCVVSDDDALNSIDCLNGGSATGVTNACACSCAAGFLGLTCDTEDTSQVLSKISSKLEETKQVLNTTKDALYLTTQTLERTNKQLVAETNVSAILVLERDGLSADKITLLAQKSELEETVATLESEKTTLGSIAQQCQTDLREERDAASNLHVLLNVALSNATELLSNATELLQRVEALQQVLSETSAKLEETKQELNTTKDALYLTTQTLERTHKQLVAETNVSAILVLERDGLSADKSELEETVTLLEKKQKTLLENKKTTHQTGSHTPAPSTAPTSLTTSKTVAKLEQRNKELEGTVVTRDEIIMVLSGVLFFCLAVLTIFCCRCLTRKKTPVIITTSVPKQAPLVGKFGQFMDRHHDAIKKIGHHNHALSVQKLSKLHSKRKVEKIQKNHFHAKGRLMARLKQRTEASHAATGAQKVAGTTGSSSNSSSNILILPGGAVISKEQKKMEKRLEKQKKKKQKKAQKRASKVAAKAEKRKNSLKKEEHEMEDVVVRVDPQVVAVRVPKEKSTLTSTEV